MTSLVRWIAYRATVIAWDVPLTRSWHQHVWTGQWSEQARRYVKM